jgi:hypothetical protein
MVVADPTFRMTEPDIIQKVVKVQHEAPHSILQQSGTRAKPSKQS